MRSFSQFPMLSINTPVRQQQKKQKSLILLKEQKFKKNNSKQMTQESLLQQKGSQLNPTLTFRKSLQEKSKFNSHFNIKSQKSINFEEFRQHCSQKQISSISPVQKNNIPKQNFSVSSSIDKIQFLSQNYPTQKQQQQIPQKENKGKSHFNLHLDLKKLETLKYPINETQNIGFRNINDEPWTSKNEDRKPTFCINKTQIISQKKSNSKKQQQQVPQQNPFINDKLNNNFLKKFSPNLPVQPLQQQTSQNQGQNQKKFTKFGRQLRLPLEQTNAQQYQDFSKKLKQQQQPQQSRYLTDNVYNINRMEKSSVIEAGSLMEDSVESLQKNLLDSDQQQQDKFYLNCSESIKQNQVNQDLSRQYNQNKENRANNNMFLNIDSIETRSKSHTVNFQGVSKSLCNSQNFEILNNNKKEWNQARNVTNNNKNNNSNINNKNGKFLDVQLNLKKLKFQDFQKVVNMGKKEDNIEFKKQKIAQKRKKLILSTVNRFEKYAMLYDD